MSPERANLFFNFAPDGPARPAKIQVRMALPQLARTEEVRGSNPLTSTPTKPWSPAWRVHSVGPVESRRVV